MPKISFIVIGYNIQNYIERCIKSILNQTINDIEIIFVDDGSTDKTVDVVKETIQNDDRVHIICQENQGANAARKTGFNHSTGEYIMFVDGDDWLALNAGEELYKIINKDNYDIVCYNYIRVYEEKNEKNIIKIYDNLKDNLYLELILKQKISHELWNKIYKREILIKAEFNNVCKTSMGEDLAANILIATMKPKVKMIDTPYYYYYQRSTSTMNNVGKRLLEVINSMEYIEEILKKKNLYNQYNKEIEYLWFIQCYHANIINCRKHNKYHKKLFQVWKDKNININENSLCQTKLNESGRIRIINFMYNINYYLGNIIKKLL